MITGLLSIFVPATLGYAVQNTVQNVYTPLPFTTHFIFCMLATFLYAVQFGRKRKPYYLVILVAIDLTMITQYTSSETVITVLGIAEALLLIGAFVLSRLDARKQKAREAAEVHEEEERRKVQEQAEQTEQKHLQDEFIDEAFRDDEYPED